MLRGSHFVCVLAFAAAVAARAEHGVSPVPPQPVETSSISAATLFDKYFSEFSFPGRDTENAKKLTAALKYSFGEGTEKGLDYDTVSFANSTLLEILMQQYALDASNVDAIVELQSAIQRSDDYLKAHNPKKPTEEEKQMDDETRLMAWDAFVQASRDHILTRTATKFEAIFSTHTKAAQGIMLQLEEKKQRGEALTKVDLDVAHALMATTKAADALRYLLGETDKKPEDNAALVAAVSVFRLQIESGKLEGDLLAAAKTALEKGEKELKTPQQSVFGGFLEKIGARELIAKVKDGAQAALEYLPKPAKETLEAAGTVIAPAVEAVTEAVDQAIAKAPPVTEKERARGEALANVFLNPREFQTAVKEGGAGLNRYAAALPAIPVMPVPVIVPTEYAKVPIPQAQPMQTSNAVHSEGFKMPSPVARGTSVATPSAFVSAPTQSPRPVPTQMPVYNRTAAARSVSAKPVAQATVASATTPRALRSTMSAVTPEQSEAPRETEEKEVTASNSATNETPVVSLRTKTRAPASVTPAAPKATPTSSAPIYISVSAPTAQGIVPASNTPSGATESVSPSASSSVSGAQTYKPEATNPSRIKKDQVRVARGSDTYGPMGAGAAVTPAPVMSSSPSYTPAAPTWEPEQESSARLASTTDTFANYAPPTKSLELARDFVMSAAQKLTGSTAKQDASTATTEATPTYNAAKEAVKALLQEAIADSTSRPYKFEAPYNSPVATKTLEATPAQTTLTRTPASQYLNPPKPSDLTSFLKSKPN